MKTKILAAIAAVAALVPFLLVGAPAHAAQNNLYCYNEGGGFVPTAAVATNGIGDPNRFEAILALYDGTGRDWYWRLYHNGSLSAKGGIIKGTFQVERTMLNFTGDDLIRAEVDNANGTIHCTGSVRFFGGG